MVTDHRGICCNPRFVFADRLVIRVIVIRIVIVVIVVQSWRGHYATNIFSNGVHGRCNLIEIGIFKDLRLNIFITQNDGLHFYQRFIQVQTACHLIQVSNLR